MLRGIMLSHRMPAVMWLHTTHPFLEPQHLYAATLEHIYNELFHYYHMTSFSQRDGQRGPMGKNDMELARNIYVPSGGFYDMHPSCVGQRFEAVS